MTGTLDAYKVLGVSSKASDADIKKAYRTLARENHPDRHPGDKAKEARFKEVSSAYGLVGDKKRRAEYDEVRSRPDFASWGQSQGPGFDLSDLLGQMFGGGFAAGGAGSGPTRVEFRTSGGRPAGRAAGPPFGGFSGGFPGAMGSDFGYAEPRTRKATRPSPPKERKIRLSDGSSAKQKGLNVYSELRIDFQEAVAGTQKSLATLHGKASVKIPPGTSSGVKLRLKAKGAQRGEKRGDHFLTVQIAVPKKLSKASKELLAEFIKSIDEK